MTDKENNTPQMTEEEQETKKSFFVGKEKHTIVLFLVLLAILSVKSILLDEVKNLTPEEAQFKEFVEYSLEEDYEGFLTDTHLMAYRVYKIQMVDDVYVGSVRGYLFSILPIRHFSVTSQIVE